LTPFGEEREQFLEAFVQFLEACVQKGCVGRSVH
jgi:hypothetical protein